MFMQPVVTQRMKFFEVEKEDGSTEFYPSDYDGEESELLSLMGDEKFRSYKVIEGYGCRMSAPGYLDCTSWNVFDSPCEASYDLMETFYDFDPEDADDDDVENLEWLESLQKKGDRELFEVISRDVFARQEVLADFNDYGECKWCSNKLAPTLYLEPDDAPSRRSELGRFCDTSCLHSYNT